jgi:hypothetical protein
VRLVVVAPLRVRFVGVVGGFLSRLAELGATNRIELQNTMKANAAKRRPRLVVFTAIPPSQVTRPETRGPQE